MTGKSYRIPAYPVAPGTSVPDEDMVIIESMPGRVIGTLLRLMFLWILAQAELRRSWKTCQ